MIQSEFFKKFGFDNHLLRTLIIGGCFSFSLITGIITLHGQYKWVLLGFGALVFAVIAIRNMIDGITLLIATCTTINFTINTGRSTPVPFGLLVLAFLCILWLVKMAVVEHHIRLAGFSFNLPFLAFLLSAVISWIAGYIIWNPQIVAPGNLFLIQAGQMAIFFLSIFGLLLVANHKIRDIDLKLWTVIIIAIGAFTISYRILIDDSFATDIITYTTINWPFILLWGQLLFNSHLKPWARGLCILISFTWLVWVISQVSSWKGGWVPAVMALGLMLWFKNKKITISLVIAGLLFAALMWGWVNKHLFQSEVDSASTIRPLFWYDVIRLTSRSPIIGLGPANYKFYWQDPTFIPLSRLAYGWHVWDAWGYSPPSHNTYVDLYSQTGIVGLGLFLWGMVTVLVLCYRIASRFKPGFHQAFSYAVFCGFIAIAITSFIMADFIIPFVYNLTITGFRQSIYSWLLMGAVISLGSAQGTMPGIIQQIQADDGH